MHRGTRVSQPHPRWVSVSPQAYLYFRGSDDQGEGAVLCQPWLSMPPAEVSRVCRSESLLHLATVGSWGEIGVFLAPLSKEKVTVGTRGELWGLPFPLLGAALMRGSASRLSLEAKRYFTFGVFLGCFVSLVAEVSFTLRKPNTLNCRLIGDWLFALWKGSLMYKKDLSRNLTYLKYDLSYKNSVCIQDYRDTCLSYLKLICMLESEEWAIKIKKYREILFM
jgi:hypothetical protein